MQKVVSVPPGTGPVPRSPSRRSVLTYGLSGFATVVAGGGALVTFAERASADTVGVRLFVNAGLRRMIDGKNVFVVGYGSEPGRVELPGGRIEVAEGDTVTVTLTNDDARAHAFAVRGVVDSGTVAPGTTRTFSFAAPPAGTYLYADPGARGVNQALGLAGPLLVSPAGAPDRLTATAPRVVQQYTWVFTEVDSRWGERARTGAAIDPATYEPDYFLVNGLSGVLAVEDENTYLSGSVGDTTLLRMVNAGRAYRSIHMHGNHFTVLSSSDQPWLVGTGKDTIRIPPGRVVDVLVPFTAPPDAYPPVARGQKYVVHDHIEMAETAAGGFYPGGMVSELVFD